jgi:2-phospho-L-lactate guanylyltransferase
VKALLEDVVESLFKAHIFHSIVVISPDPTIIDHLSTNYVSFQKQIGTGLNGAVQQAIRVATTLKSESITVVLGDIPLADSSDFIELFKLGGDREKVVLAPSLKGGTNVMMLRPPNSISPSYGRWSYAKHHRLAQKKGLNAYSMSNPRLAFDIDTQSDLIELRQLDPTGKTKAGKIVRKIVTLPMLRANN